MKFEYGDFYKFIASLGIALISLAVLVPWLFLREPFDLFVKQSDISSLTLLAQSIVQERQALIQSALSIVPWFSIGSFVLGVIIFIIGGVMWLNKTQKLLDKLNALNVRALENQIAEQTPQETIARREEEAKAQIEEEESKTPVPLGEKLEPDNVKIIIENIDRIQRRLVGLLVSCWKSSYTILTERFVGPVSLDVVMIAKRGTDKDIIFDVKYIRKGFKYNWLRDNVLKNIYASEIYQNETNRQAIPILFIVSSGELPAMTTGYMDRIQKEINTLNKTAQVVILSEIDLYNMDCIKLKSVFKF